MQRWGWLTAVGIGALVAAGAASADVRVDGHGFGHGVGLSQYGALGMAQAGQDFGSILGHYYPGTTVGAWPRARIRVRLKEQSALRVTGATLARAADGRLLRLRAGRTYRLSAWGVSGLLRAVDRTTWRGVGHLRPPVRLTGPAPLGLLGLAENGVADGRYRGALVLSLDAAQPGQPVPVLAVDDVDLEQYLYGVVGSEMPASWPAQALEAQAVAARSYALISRRRAQPFDVYADTRSQMYRGVAGESPSATAAVLATRRLVVLWSGAVAQTLFGSSSGGRTAAVQEAFPGSQAVPYLQSVDDPYDSVSPYHDWSVTFTDADLAQRLAPVTKGTLLDVAVTATTPEGRAQTVRVTGTLGAQDVAAATIRRLLGLRSTWFTITRLPAPGP